MGEGLERGRGDGMRKMGRICVGGGGFAVCAGEGIWA